MTTLAGYLLRLVAAIGDRLSDFLNHPDRYEEAE